MPSRLPCAALLGPARQSGNRARSATGFGAGGAEGLSPTKRARISPEQPDRNSSGLRGEALPAQLAPLDARGEVGYGGEQLLGCRIGTGGERQRRRLAFGGVAGGEHALQISQRLGVRV